MARARAGCGGSGSSIAEGSQWGRGGEAESPESLRPPAVAAGTATEGGALRARSVARPVEEAVGLLHITIIIIIIMIMIMIMIIMIMIIIIIIIITGATPWRKPSEGPVMSLARMLRQGASDCSVAEGTERWNE